MWKKVIGEIRLRLEAGLGWVGSVGFSYNPGF